MLLVLVCDSLFGFVWVLFEVCNDCGIAREVLIFCDCSKGSWLVSGVACPNLLPRFICLCFMYSLCIVHFAHARLFVCLFVSVWRVECANFGGQHHDNEHLRQALGRVWRPQFMRFSVRTRISMSMSCSFQFSFGFHLCCMHVFQFVCHVCSYVHTRLYVLVHASAVFVASSRSHLRMHLKSQHF